MKRLLHNEWRFCLDQDDLGESEKWYNKRLPDRILIPGILQSQGYGEKIHPKTPFVQSLYDKLWYMREEYQYAQEEECNVPFLAGPPRHYIGKAWYQTDFTVNKEEEELLFSFRIECTRWQTTCYLDKKKVGRETSLCTSHNYELGQLTEGEHTLTICVDTGFIYPYRPDGHAVSDALLANWNGLVGEASLEAKLAVRIQSVDIKTLENSIVQVDIEVENGQEETEVLLSLSDEEWNRKQIHVCRAVSGSNHYSVTLRYPKEEVLIWDEFTPYLYTVKVAVSTNNMEGYRLFDKREIMFGFRDLVSKDGLFYVNGRPTYFRGTHFGGDFPITGYPVVQKSYWSRMFRIVKEWGLNFVRFHSYCPPEAAFCAADELGVYLQIECGMWNDFEKDSLMCDVLKEETIRILRQFGNHPSFVLFSPSNEPGGDWLQPLTEWVSFCKRIDGRRFYTIQSGWPYPMPPAEITGTDYVYFHRSGYGMQPGGTIRNSGGWHGKDYRESLEGIKVPVICHELGQWCSYPDFDRIDTFTGFMQPSNYKVYKENMIAAGLFERNKAFVYASGKLQTEMYKEELEANFRTPHLYGFELLDLHDYMGQGTALVGLLDVFWKEKGYCKADEFRRFCFETVLLLRLKKRTYTTKERIKADVECTHFGKEALSACTVYWNVKDDQGQLVEAGSFENKELPIAKNIKIGRLSISLSGYKTPNCYTIEIGIENIKIFNSWTIWVYAEAVSWDKEHPTAYGNVDVKTKSPGIIETDTFAKAIEALDNGEKVLFTPNLSNLQYDCPPIASRPVFWNSQMGPTWMRGLGLLIQNEHPVFSHFPTSDYQEWQWNEIIEGARAINLKAFPEEITIKAQVIDEWNRNDKLGLMVECRVKKGSLVLASTDFSAANANQPALRQLRKSLLYYMQSEEFQPVVQVTKEQLLSIYYPNHLMEHLQPKIAMSQQGEGLDEMMSGNPDTNFVLEQVTFPLEITFSFERSLEFVGFSYMPRQNQREHKGDIRCYEVKAFVDNGWKTVAKGEWGSSYALKEVHFTENVCTDQCMLIVLGGFEDTGISNWNRTKDGWEHSVSDYKETTVAIAEIAFLPKNICEFEYTGAQRKQVFGSGKSSTAEIDN